MFAPLQSTTGTIRLYPEDSGGDRAPRPRHPAVDPDALFAASAHDERTPLLGIKLKKRQLEDWLEGWATRWILLVVMPASLIVLWTCIPFSLRSDTDRPPFEIGPAPQDVRFLSFLFLFFAPYLTIALGWTQSLFKLYRVNTPSRLNPVFCALGIAGGALIHYTDLFGLQSRREKDDDVDWRRKGLWTTIALFCSLAGPALACFGKIRSKRKSQNRRSLTSTQKTFLDGQIVSRLPRSYVRFLWFLLQLGLAFLILPIGQGCASAIEIVLTHTDVSAFFYSLPHSNVQTVLFVWALLATVQIFNVVSMWLLDVRIRSRALQLVFRLYFSMSYAVIYRSLFTRLQRTDQFAGVQLLSSAFVILVYPVSMSRPAYKFMCLFGYDKSYEIHVDVLAQSLFVRAIAENVTMLSFLGYLNVLHFGPNRDVFPLFSFEEDGPFDFRLTLLGALAVWAAELISSFIARSLCQLIYEVDVTEVGIGALAEYDGLLEAILFTEIHVVSDLLLFLIRLRF